jgi:hypothetical protein
MSDQPAETMMASEGGQDRMFALFAQLILQQTNMAMMLLGKIAHPESGQIHKDVEAARLFIDQLEMLEVKTRGNLTKEESGLLKQSLMDLRLTFVDSVDQANSPTEPRVEKASGAPIDVPPGSSANTPPSTAEEEHRKKFSKKY